MPASPAFHNAVRAARDTVRQVQGWTWSYDGRMYYLRDGQDTVGTVALLPGAVEHEGVLMDLIVAHLNKETTQ